MSEPVIVTTDRELDRLVAEHVFGLTLRRACILGPDATYSIRVDGRLWRFDWHSYLGPYVLGKRGDPLAREPKHVLRAISLWAQQGQRIEDGECVWFREPEAILAHVTGRHYRVTGYRPALRGA